ncbi:MAG TPA: hypothetical protein VIS71_04745 [Terrimicrobium sp.]
MCVRCPYPTLLDGALAFPVLLLGEHAAALGIPPEKIERWRQREIVVAEFDAANRIENDHR